jgi:hypothetical protein
MALAIPKSAAHYVQYLKWMEEHSFVRIRISKGGLDPFEKIFIRKEPEQEYLGVADRLLVGNPLRTACQTEVHIHLAEKEEEFPHIQRLKLHLDVRLGRLDAGDL